MTPGDAPLVALTGGTGFIGRYVAAGMGAAGWRVRLLCRGDVVHPLLAATPLDLVPGDLSDEAALRRLVRGADAVVHLAGLTKAPDPQSFLRVNRDGTARLVAAVASEAEASQAGAPRRILVSSLAARAPELSSYAASKRAGEEIAALAGWTILRPGVVYGPGDEEGRALHRLATAPFAPVPVAPKPRLAMIHARDLAGAIQALCGQDAGGGLFELADARPAGYELAEVLALMARLLGRQPPRPVPLPDGVFLLAGLAADAVASITGQRGVFGRGKARELLHRDWAADPALAPPPWLWQPRITLQEGLAETVRWWRQGWTTQAGLAAA